MKLHPVSPWNRLSVRLSAGIALLTLLALSSFAWLAMRAQEEHLTNEVLRGALLVGETIKSGTVHLMLTNRRDELRLLVETVGQQHGIEGVRVLNKEGRVALSSNAGEIGTVVDRRAEPCYPCHAADQPILRPAARSRSRVVRRGDHRTLGMIAPVYNEPRCYTAACHVHRLGEEVLGVIDVNISLADVDRDMAEVRGHTLLSAFLALLSSAVLVSWFVRRSVVRPVTELVRGVEGVAGGDLHRKVDVSRRDEIGRLARSFNQMAESLAERRRELDELTGNLEREVEQRTAALRASEARYRTLAEAAQDHIFVVGRDFRIEYVNTVAARHLGRPPAEIVGRRLSELFPGPTWEHQRANLEAVFRNHEPLYSEAVFDFPSGDVWLSTWLVPLKDDANNVIAILEVSRDITDRRRAEAALRSSEAKLRSLLEHVPVGVAQSTPDGRILTANPALVEMLRYGSEEELLAVNARDLYANPSDRENLLGRLDEAGVVRQVEMVLRRKDGSPLHGLLSMRAVRDEQGALLHYEGTLVDITERKRLEDQARAAQRMEAIGRLAGGIAHDFNNLLTVILGACEFAAEDLGPDHPVAPEIRAIKNAGESAASLTRQLLAFSRRQVLEPQVLDLNNVVARLEQPLRRLIGEDIEITTHLEPALDRILADPGQLEQIIFNLAANARDAMPQGGRLTLETRNVQLDESHLGRRVEVAVTPGAYVMLAVSDTGHGMDEEIQRHIFEPFFTTKPMDKGTGLGLSTVFGIVKQSGGYIWVYSAPGQGATFKIYLPRVEATGASAAATRSESEAQRGNETILFVEDDAALRELGRRTLERFGYTVLVASDGLDALSLWKRHGGPIHLLVTDVVLPGMRGEVLVQELRQLRPDLPVLYVSGYPEGATDDLHRGDAAFLAKPFTSGSLAAKIRQVLDAGKR